MNKRQTKTVMDFVCRVPPRGSSFKVVVNTAGGKLLLTALSFSKLSIFLVPMDGYCTVGHRHSQKKCRFNKEDDYILSYVMHVS